MYFMRGLRLSVLLVAGLISGQVCLAQNQHESAQEILDKAIDAQLSWRNIRFDFQSRNECVAIEMDGGDEEAVGEAGSYNILSGQWTSAMDKHRLAYKELVFDKTGTLIMPRERVEAFDGQVNYFLRINNNQTKGYIDKHPLGERIESGAWIVTGRLYGIAHPGEAVSRRSIFDLMRNDSIGLLKLNESVIDERKIYNIRGKMSWGECELSLDASRGYHVVGMTVTISPAKVWNMEKVVYALKDISLQEVEGIWLPKGFVLEETYVWKDAEMGDGEIMNRIETKLSEVELLGALVNDEMFYIQWPDGTKVEDRLQSRF